MNNDDFTLNSLGDNRYCVTDNETGFSITFMAGDYNNSQKAKAPDKLPEHVDDIAKYAARAMRRIGDYIATQHPELV